MVMEARHRGMRSNPGGIPTNLLVHITDVEDPPSGYDPYYHLPIPSKERRTWSRTAWVGIGISVSMLFVIAFFIYSRYDVVHHALSTSRYSGLPEDFGGTNGMLKKPSGFPSTMKSQSRLEKEHASKVDKQAKLKGKDSLRSKENTKTTKVPSTITSQPVSLSAATTEPDLAILVQIQVEKVRRMKHDLHIVMETDPTAQSEIAVLQNLLRQFVPQRYGPEPYFVEMKVHFPDSMTVPNLINDGTVLIQLAPLQLMPYAVFYFLQVVDTWKGGAFHRVAGHVLQAMARTPVSSLAFQEYSPLYPHIQHSLGFAG